MSCWQSFALSIKSNKVCVLWYYWFYYTEKQVLLTLFWRRKYFRTNVPILITRHIIPVRKKEELLNIIDPVSYMRLKFIDTLFPCCHTGCQAAIVSWYCKIDHLWILQYREEKKSKELNNCWTFLEEHIAVSHILIRFSYNDIDKVLSVIFVHA